MTLLDLVTLLSSVVLVMFVVAISAFVGWRRFIASLSDARTKLRDVAPHLALISAVLLLNRLARYRGQELSWAIGWNITEAVYAIEGNLVGTIQSFASLPLTVFFSFVYVYGYVFLTAFPLVAYFALNDGRLLKETIVAYSLNYLIGLVLYTLVISYGPRNLIPASVDSLLYTTYPSVMLLTSKVNTNTNVFPSLHSSLSTTAALLAWRSADVYRRWFFLSIPLVASILVSTMYLGIHWAVDVVAGVILGWICVRVAVRYPELPAVLKNRPSWVFS